ncbi:hypothetical protein DQ04_06771020 [Trypanosoma grayi]|uniref:hypothetical protein n=1 Tax=Trypanosoma grayi TaxID=71804 RepID=UPI0004F476A9|nr:hypothetical protein DQ04_06771020 [Trypanosoma grayi]KEG08630.1 hypothetical protein DQ04_06771020 [Trypanosoma grayi]
MLVGRLTEWFTEALREARLRPRPPSSRASSARYAWCTNSLWRYCMECRRWCISFITLRRKYWCSVRFLLDRTVVVAWLCGEYGNGVIEPYGWLVACVGCVASTIRAAFGDACRKDDDDGGACGWTALVVSRGLVWL